MAEEMGRVDEVEAALELISRELLPGDLRLVYLHVDELREQDVNPRSMPQKMFNQLVENIQEAGVLESVPLCVYTEGVYHIISGHHRVRAARAAGVSRVLALVYDDLPAGRVHSKQLAHNTISGVDDPELVQRLWLQIDDVKARLEAFVDPRSFKAIPEPVRYRPVDVDMAAVARKVLIVFLSTQATDFDAAVQAILPNVELDAVYLAGLESYEGWKAALQRVREELEIAAIPTAIAEMARLALQALGEEGEDVDG